MKRFLPAISIIIAILFSFLTRVNAQSNQTVANGSSTTAVNFTGSGCVFNWTNSNPSIGLSASGTGNIPSFTAINTGSSPVTATINVNPGPVPIAYIANENNATVSAVNTTTHAVIATIPVGMHPIGVSVNPNGTTAYISNNNLSGTVSVINTITNTVTATITVGSFPDGLALSPDGTRLYVTNDGANTISVINTATNTVIVTVPVGSNPYGITVSPDGTRVYVTNYASNNVSIINTATNTVITAVTVGLYPVAVSVNPISNLVYVANQNSNTISVINPATNTITATIPVGQSPVGVTVSPDGTRMYVVNANSNSLGVVNTATNTVITTIPVGTLPYGVSVTPDGSMVYVSNEGSNTLTGINTTTNTVVSTVNVGANPYSTGSFITIGSGCGSSPSTFTITVNPTPTSVITATNVLAALSTTYGTPSASTSFTLAGTNVTTGVLVTPPLGFEVSTDNINFSPTVTVGSSGTIASTKVYIRLAKTTPVGAYSGNIVLTGTGATPVNVVMPNSPVTPISLNIIPTDVSKVYGTAITGGAGSTLFTAIGLKNSETIGSVTIAYGTGAAATANAGTYAGSITASAVTGGTFNPVNYIITYSTGNIVVTPATLTITADDKSRAYGTANPVLTVTYSGFVNNESPTQLTSLPDVTTTAALISPAGQYPITVNNAASPDYTFIYVPGVLTISPAMGVIVPNAFTPNGDGINDTWNIQNITSYPNCTVAIFNRYGDRVYSSIGYGTPWDGTRGGSGLSSGTYYYVIDLKNGSGVLSGSVTVIR